MTQEEALKILRKDSLSNLVGYYSSEELQEVIDIVVSQPSLPSNLDESANNYGVDIRFEYPRVMDETDKYIYNAFKAGAEWMAGQGETFNGYISLKGKRSLIAIEGKSDTCEFGDKVIVQIRKKQ